MPSVTYENGRFVCHCTFHERDIPKKAGFVWDPKAKHWYATQPRSAAGLRQYFDSSAKAKLDPHLITVEPWSGRLTVPDGLKLYPFQETAVRFALSRNRSYLGLEMGLGKTPVAAVIQNEWQDPAFYICPPHLARNTKAEFEKWCDLYTRVRIIPDSVLAREDTIAEVAAFARNSAGPATLFVDEAHRYKNPTAKRTKALFKILPLFKRVVFLSGTPMPNRPIELFPILSNAAPELIDFMNRYEFAMKYCNAYETKFGWDFNGASTDAVKELGERMRATFMLRMFKKDVLKELPPKTEEIVLFTEDMPPKAARLDRRILEFYSPEDLLKADVAASLNLGEEELHLGTYRRMLGNLKAKAAAKFIAGELEDDEDLSILVFAVHKETIALLAKYLGKYIPLVITGDTPMVRRHEIVKEFQDPKMAARVFIGNIQAAGTGITLTKASRVIFVESSWTPADNDQAADRSHRIGQKDTVHVQYLTYQNSVDKAVLQTILKKREVIKHV